jgi:hypothetical protein
VLVVVAVLPPPPPPPPPPHAVRVRVISSVLDLIRNPISRAANIGAPLVRWHRDSSSCADYACPAAAHEGHVLGLLSSSHSPWI